MNLLPTEIDLMILGYLEFKDLFIMMRTSKLFRSVALLIEIIKSRTPIAIDHRFLLKYTNFKKIEGNVYLKANESLFEDVGMCNEVGKKIMPMVSDVKFYLEDIDDASDASKWYLNNRGTHSNRLTMILPRNGLPRNPMVQLTPSINDEYRYRCLTCNDLDFVRVITKGDICTSDNIEYSYISPCEFRMCRIPVDMDLYGESVYIVPRLARLKPPHHNLNTLGIVNGWTSIMNLLYIMVYASAIDIVELGDKGSHGVDMDLLGTMASILSVKFNPRATILCSRAVSLIIDTMTTSNDSLEHEFHALALAPELHVETLKIIGKFVAIGIPKPEEELINVAILLSYGSLHTMATRLGIKSGGKRSDLLLRMKKYLKPSHDDPEDCINKWDPYILRGNVIKRIKSQSTIKRFVETFGAISLS